MSDYLGMLQLLDSSCRRFGCEHIVLTDNAAVAQLSVAGLRSLPEAA